MRPKRCGRASGRCSLPGEEPNALPVPRAAEGTWAKRADVSGDALSERLQNQDADDELGRLAKVLNDTFERHEQAFQQLWVAGGRRAGNQSSVCAGQ